MSLHGHPQAGPTRGTGVAPLLYWLAVICGLSGVTLLRFEDPRRIVPLWFGSVVGVALGQIFALLRVRAWVVVVAVIGSIWLVGPLAYFGITALFGGGDAAETALLTLLPAAVCGYASLSERGGLLAFWYPAMLWMLVILDGGAPASVTSSSAAPFAAGLAAMFVAYLRARQSRRIELWRTYGTARLAPPRAKSVLRERPLAAVAQHASSALAFTGALTIAAWIAPELWQKEQAKHEQALLLPSASPTDPESGLPCCHAPAKLERVSEYLTLGHGQESAPHSDPLCVTCQVPTVPGPDPNWSYAGTPGAGLTGEVGADTWTGYTGGTDLPSPVPSSPAPSTAATYVDPPAPAPPPVLPEPTPPPAPEPTPLAPKTAALAPSPPPAVATATAGATVPTRTGLPWRWLLFSLPLGLGLHLLVRATRRTLTLRHLERPFWSESTDQRVSNHWQRVLIGLRDAGIRMHPNEAPSRFARRVAIPGMVECATILERVRHGVRVDDEDLTTMRTRATCVYNASQARAGLGGRVAAAVRWPLV